MELFLFQLAILIFSVVIHEVSHGVVANSLGDPTAKNAGRLTLNPIPHIDPVGSVIVPLFLLLASSWQGGGIIFGWAKPVPINPFNFRDQKWGQLKVGLAGPASNFAIAIAFGLILRFFPLEIFGNSAFPSILGYIVRLNLLLGIFNLFPFPPLDGSHVLFSLLPRSFDALKILLSQYGFLLIFLLIFFFFGIISSLIRLIFSFIAGASVY
ncbi:MAG: site-2 protease family protein [Candidatus Wildermuthbacteria bacterium]|nr:site-2 protease family protein [Candidatus Wildermuthbacteria bacterium]